MSAAPPLRLFQVDAFTRVPFTGNAAGVVFGGDHLESAAMQSIARELNNSETAFLLAPRSSDHEVFIRYFTPIIEVPICGHATIAAHYVRSRILGLPTSRVLQRSAAGLLPVDVIAGDDYRIVMTQQTPTLGPKLSTEWREQLAASLGLAAGSLEPGLPVRKVSTGSPKLLVPLPSSEILNAIVPDLRAIERLTREAGVNGLFAFTLRPDIDGVLTEARMFAPAIGIAEDPVTGNGNGPLGAYLAAERVLPPNGVHTFNALQGRAIHRPGIVHVEVTTHDGHATRVRVGDEAVIVFETTYAA
jgi:PhzF family phenazine biosynthesis protein